MAEQVTVTHLADKARKAADWLQRHNIAEAGQWVYLRQQQQEVICNLLCADPPTPQAVMDSFVGTLVGAEQTLIDMYEEYKGVA